MSKKKKTLRELGEFKIKINNALLKSENIREVVLGDVSTLKQSELITAFKEHIKSHLFVDETIKDTSTYIFYDVHIPMIYPEIKNTQILVYAICHRDILDNYTKEGYFGNRTDILAQMIEDVLLDDGLIKSFGIGDLDLDNVDIYNSITFYGRILTFNVKNFR